MSCQTFLRKHAFHASLDNDYAQNYFTILDKIDKS